MVMVRKFLALLKEESKDNGDGEWMIVCQKEWKKGRKKNVEIKWSSKAINASNDPLLYV